MLYSSDGWRRKWGANREGEWRGKEPAVNDRKGLRIRAETQGSMREQDRPWESFLHPAQSHVQTMGGCCTDRASSSGASLDLSNSTHSIFYDSRAPPMGGRWIFQCPHGTEEASVWSPRCGLINSQLIMLTLQNNVLKGIIISFCALYLSPLVNIHGDS